MVFPSNFFYFSFMMKYFCVLFFLCTFAFVGESRNLEQISHYAAHYSVVSAYSILEDSKFPARYEDEVFTRSIYNKDGFIEEGNENLVESGDDENLNSVDFFDPISPQDIIRPMVGSSENQKTHPLKPHNDIQIGVNQKKVDIFIRLYTQKKRKAFLIGLGRAPKYYKMVQRIFAEYGLPHDLFYLAMVESNFNYKAVSRASAVGLWQFIGSTGRLYGMRYSWWYDDRLDPEVQTHAAARFLKDLYKRYNDWSLVLAAYNSGLGRVNHAIAKNKKAGKPTDYWSLKLPRETRGYVPAFLAVVHIFNNLEYYDFPAPSELKDWHRYKKVRVKPNVSFKQISKKTKISVAELKQLNPSLKYSTTPFSKNSHKRFILKVPEKSVITQKQLNSLKPDIESTFITHRVVKGDSLWSISRKYNTSLKNLYASNYGLSAKKYLKPRQKVIIPITFTKPNQKANSKKGNPGIHIVRRGDTLWDIAKRYSTTVDLLVAKNYHITSLNDKIIIGSKIAY